MATENEDMKIMSADELLGKAKKLREEV